MIPLSALQGRPVVDLDRAMTIGTIDAAILDLDHRRVLGFAMARSPRILLGHTTAILPASAIHAVGADAVTVHQVVLSADEVTRLQGFPRVADLVGRQVVTRSGRKLGMIDDILIDEGDGRIVGYLLGATNLPQLLERRLAADPLNRVAQVTRKGLAELRVAQGVAMRFIKPLVAKETERPYVKADADINVGPDLVVIPDDAVSHEWTSGDAGATASSESRTPAHWSDAA